MVKWTGERHEDEDVYKCGCVDVDIRSAGRQQAGRQGYPPNFVFVHPVWKTEGLCNRASEAKCERAVNG